MSLREIIKVPNPFLKVTAKPVTVIDKNILTIDNMDILDTKVVMTIINGEVVYTHE